MPGARARLRAAAAPTTPVLPLPWDGVPTRRAERSRGVARRISGLRWRVPVRTALAAVAALALVGGAVALRVAPTATGPVVDLPEPVVTRTAGAQPAETPAPTPGSEVWVHVVGHVAAPGVFALPAGSRVGEAVAAAGGALPDADLAAVNLAAVVADGAQVRVPAPGKDVAAAAPPVGDPATGTGTAADGVVDVNRADVAALQALPGIGPVLAERIVAWRAEHGAFGTPADLQDVPGIGPALMSRIASQVRAGRRTRRPGARRRVDGADGRARAC